MDYSDDEAEHRAKAKRRGRCNVEDGEDKEDDLKTEEGKACNKNPQRRIRKYQTAQRYVATCTEVFVQV